MTATVVATPTLSTTATSGAVGGTISDTASITGGSSPTGTVTFKAYSNSTCTTLAYTSDPVTLSGGQASASFAPTTAGSYYWRATYSGDAANDSVTSACNLDPNETSTVAAPVTVSPASLAAATVGQAYSQSLSASGGTAPYTFEVSVGALPAGLTLTSGGSLSGTPTASGSFNFTVKATDSAARTGSRAYTLTVSAPTINVSPASLPHAKAAHAYSQTISATGGTSPYAFSRTAGALPGGLTLASDGTLSGTPTAAGTFDFSVTATDSTTGGGPYTGTRAYSLVVDPNGAPSLAGGGTLAYTENAPATTVSGTLSVTEPEGDALKGASVSIGAGYASGEDQLSWVDNDSGDGITLASGSTDRALSLTGAGTATQYQAALRAVTYTNSSENPSTADRTVTFTATDTFDATGSGSATIHVSATNDAPTVADDSYSTGENTSLSVSAPGVLGNDADVDNTTLNAVLVDDVSHGTLTLSSNGSFSYAPATNYHGGDSFTYRANDGTANSTLLATVTITVTRAHPDLAISVSDAPDPVATGGDITYTLAVTNNGGDASGVSVAETVPDHTTGVSLAGPQGSTCSDADGASAGSSLTCSLPSLARGASATFTFVVHVDADAPGPISNSASASDDGANGTDSTPQDNSGTETTTVRHVPVAVDDSYSTNEDTALTVATKANGVLGNDTDGDGDTLSAVSFTNPSHGTLTANTDGTFTYTPAANFNGQDSFTYKANDGTTDSTLAATVTITVDPANDPPAGTDGGMTIDEDSSHVFAVSDFGFTDPDTGDALSAVRVDTVPPAGTLQLNGVDVTAGQVIAAGDVPSLVFTPAANGCGAPYATFAFSVADHDGVYDPSANALTFDVTCVNNLPVANGDAYSTAEDTPLTVSTAATGCWATTPMPTATP